MTSSASTATYIVEGAIPAKQPPQTLDGKGSSRHEKGQASWHADDTTRGDLCEAKGLLRGEHEGFLHAPLNRGRGICGAQAARTRGGKTPSSRIIGGMKACMED